MIGKIWSPECLDEEKTQSSGTTFDRGWRKLAVAKQVNLVIADVVWTEAVRRTAEVLRKILHRMDVGTNRVLRVVATLEFIQHQLPEMGHSNLLVTQTLHRQECWGPPRGSVRRASGLVQTGLRKSFASLLDFWGGDNFRLARHSGATVKNVQNADLRNFVCSGAREVSQALRVYETFS